MRDDAYAASNGWHRARYVGEDYWFGTHPGVDANCGYARFDGRDSIGDSWWQFASDNPLRENDTVTLHFSDLAFEKGPSTALTTRH